MGEREEYLLRVLLTDLFDKCRFSLDVSDVSVCGSLPAFRDNTFCFDWMDICHVIVFFLILGKWVVMGMLFWCCFRLSW